MTLKEQRLEVMLAQAKSEILTGGRFCTLDYLAGLWGKAPEELRLSLQQAEAKQVIFSIEYQGQVFYPDYAFLDIEKDNLLPSLAEVIKVLHSTRGGWGMAFWFRTPNNFLEGQRPEDVLLQSPEAVISAAWEEVEDIMPG